MTPPLYLTLGRFIAPLVICPLLLIPGGVATWLAALVFTLAAITDWADGWLARLHGTESEMGRILDPVADKLLVLMTVLALVAAGRVTGIGLGLCFVLFFREIGIAALREACAGRLTLRVSVLAKAKSFLTFVALGLLILGGSVQGLGTLVLAVATALSLITGYHYTRALIAQGVR